MLAPLAKLGHSRLVVLSKRALLGLTGLMFLAVVVISWINEHGSSGRLVLESVEPGVTLLAKPVMVKPHYQGIDNKNRPFTITAETATDEGNKVYTLAKVTADLAPDTLDWVGLTSEKAVYYSAEERVDFSGGVQLTNDAGYIFNTSKATLMVKDSTANGEDIVEGTGPGGTLRADRFEVVDGGNKIMFYGHVHVTIHRKSNP